MSAVVRIAEGAQLQGKTEPVPGRGETGYGRDHRLPGCSVEATRAHRSPMRKSRSLALGQDDAMRHISKLQNQGIYDDMNLIWEMI
jgi:hypothetical protein